MAPVCPHCGFDFPDAPVQIKERRGLAYSGLADAALVVGAIATVLGSLLSLGVAVLAVLAHSWISALSNFIFSLVLLALFVVFQRVADAG